MPEHAPLRILVVANKSWECEPVVQVLAHPDARPASLTELVRGFDPLEPRAPESAGARFRGNPPARPRLCLRLGDDTVEVWCIEDWMCTERTIDGPRGRPVVIKPGTSSSYEKFTGSLPTIATHAFGGEPPSIVIAMGTAGIPSAQTLNGCVTIGSRCYLRNPWVGARAKDVAEQVARFGPMLRKEVAGYASKVIASPRLARKLFTHVSMDARYAAEARFLLVPIHAAAPPRILAGHGYAALSTININDYDDYVWADEETLRRFERSVKQREIGSMETTHALIRIRWRTTPFLFVSGLTDRVPMFNAEVTPRKYAQNFVAAHNAGVAIAYLVPELSRLHRTGQLWQ
jgi:hypothetical protein